MRRRRNPRGTVSASALSQMGVCERLAVFERREGKRPSPAQKAALRLGVRAHRAFASEGASQGVAGEPRIGRCFIATHVFGEGSETAALRCLRDRNLRHSRMGRSLILGYYRVAPSVCQIMECWPLLRVLARAVLMPLVWLAKRCLDAREARGVD